MKPAPPHTPPPRAVFACLALGFTMMGCADQANPVLPSTSGPGGVVAGGTSDGGTTSDSISPRDSVDGVVDTVTPPSSDALFTACDLLKQDCPALGRPGEGCYPQSGSGRCQSPGGVGLLGSCTVGNSQPDCDRGSVCIALSPPDTFGVCLELCDTNNPTAVCGFGTLCQLLPGFPKTSNVGYCQSA